MRCNYIEKTLVTLPTQLFFGFIDFITKVQIHPVIAAGIGCYVRHLFLCVPHHVLVAPQTRAIAVGKSVRCANYVAI